MEIKDNQQQSSSTLNNVAIIAKIKENLTEMLKKYEFKFEEDKALIIPIDSLGHVYFHKAYRIDADGKNIKPGMAYLMPINGGPTIVDINLKR